MNDATDKPALNALQSLLQTMRTLRNPGGCDWDRQQTPDSLKKYLLEEAYEVVDAIDRGEPGEICEELGDLLYQVVFQAQIFSERETFGIAEVATSIDSKLKRRHPHIFAADDPQDREHDWERIKREERAEKGQSLRLGSRIPQALPALKRAKKLVGALDRESGQKTQPLGTTRQITGYLAELGKEPLTRQQAESHIGNILYQLTALARSLEVDAEEALRLSVDQRIKEHDTESGEGEH